MNFDFKLVYTYLDCIYCHNIHCHNHPGNFRLHDDTVLCSYSFHKSADTPDHTFDRDILRQRNFHFFFTSYFHLLKCVNEFNDQTLYKR